MIERLPALEQRIRAVIEHRRANDPTADDPVRGLYLPDEHLDHLFSRTPAPGGAPQADGDRLARLAKDFELDVFAVLVALAPDLDPRFETFYAYLNDDVSRRRATPAVVFEFAGIAPWALEAREAIGALVHAGLLLVEDEERPFLSRALRVPDAITDHLLGDDRPDPQLVPLLTDPVPRGDPSALLRALDAGARLCYLRGPEAMSLAVAALGENALTLDLTRGAPLDIRALARAARLRGAAVIAGPIESLEDVSALTTLPVPTILTGRKPWDPGWSATVPVTLDVVAPDRAERAASWRANVSAFDPAPITGHLRMTPTQIERAAEAARWSAITAGRELNADDLRAGARAQNAAGLERLARRIEPRVGWDDLVLAPESLAPLRALAARARLRELVLEEWGLRGRAGAVGHGISALFAGPSGTGKTLAAEVIAADVGLELYTVDLATVVDKYVGETEKNLDRIFTEADEVNALLFFDEADALFGRRSDVRDAHDRYANIEVAFLLQRMEGFNGIAILATNLRANVDEAFTRRLDAMIDFQPPDAACRRRLWEVCLGRRAPRAPDVDLDFCAEAFELSGGHIRSIVLSAGYAAAARGEGIGMRDLIGAVEQEYRKLGRLCSEAEFGPWLPARAA